MSEKPIPVKSWAFLAGCLTVMGGSILLLRGRSKRQIEADERRQEELQR